MNVTLAILGPTASGKTAFAIEIAQKLNGEIVCLDSSTVYRGLNIGTCKPTESERSAVVHHLLDIINPDEPFSAYHFVELAEQAIVDIQSRHKMPIVVGGTYFYLRALQNGMYPNAFIAADVLEEIERRYFEDEVFDTARMHADLAQLDPQAAQRIHANDRYRLVRALAIASGHQGGLSALRPKKVSSAQHERVWVKYAMVLSRRELGARIAKRVDAMLSTGLVEEVKELVERYPTARSLNCIGYSEAKRFIAGELTDKQLRNEIIEKTRQFAKRQITWLKSDPQVRYVDSRDVERIVKEVGNLTYALETPP